MEPTEYMESTSVRFEWVIRGVQDMFESSKGELKSKVMKSARFGGGRWQILFYPNAGITNAEGHGFVSLYLACEPTAEEKETAVNGKWAREGVYKFGFEVRNLQRTIMFNSKEANDHSFTYKTVNWGWAQFFRRDLLFQQSTAVRQTDAIMIICTITSTPTPPMPPPANARQPVPKDLLDSMGSLLDDPAYSDVEFVLPRRRGAGSKSIYAAQRLLRRVEYFDTMFRSGFAEGSALQSLSGAMHGLSDCTVKSGDVDMHSSEEDDATNTPTPFQRFQDSDDEDDDDDGILEDHEIQTHPPATDIADKDARQRHNSESWDTMDDTNLESVSNSSTTGDFQSTPQIQVSQSHRNTLVEKNVRDPAVSIVDGASVSGPQKTRVVVKDVAYSTYRAVLYYIYTDYIVFAPLASTFNKQGSPSFAPPTIIGRGSRGVGVSTPAAMAPETQASFQLGHTSKSSTAEVTIPNMPRARKEWIIEWQANNPGKPRPCSAKAVYRLADRLDLPELKGRAFQHINKSLTAENIAYEVFSDFSAAFEDVRKVEVQFFLDHWTDIRGSEAMRNVWQQIRVGRHPGFEEVWPLIAENLEFKPRSSETDSERSSKQTQ